MKRAAWVELNPYYVRDIDLDGNGILNIRRWRKLLKAGSENNLFGPIVNIPKNGPKATIRDFTKGNSENEASGDALYDIGKYNERRRNMYETDLFQDTKNAVGGYQGKREIHMGVDIGGPVNTKIYAFCDCEILHFGYNEPKGDYGYVIITSQTIRDYSSIDPNAKATFYSLYGHLSKKSIEKCCIGQKVKKGEIIGYMGDRDENGDWASHVHFQLSINKPETHDLPGVVSDLDHSKACMDFPDPRLVLGDIYLGNGSGRGGMWVTGDTPGIDNYKYEENDSLKGPEHPRFAKREVDAKLPEFKDSPQCSTCGLVNRIMERTDRLLVWNELFKCTRCLKAFYCSKDCQKKHWPTHKRECNKEYKRRKKIANEMQKQCLSYLESQGFPTDMMETVCISTPEEARKLGYLPKKKDQEEAEKLYASYKKRDPGCDPFVSACEKGKRKDVQLFIESGMVSDVNRYDSMGFTGLINAVRKEHVDVVQYLLTLPTISLAKGDRRVGGNPVDYAANFNQKSTDILKLLLNHPQCNTSIINNTNHDNWTAMDCCLGINRSDIGHEIVRLLKEKGGHYNENLDVLMDGNFRLRYGQTYSKDTFDRKAFVRKFEVASGRNLDDQYLPEQIWRPEPGTYCP